MMMSLARNLRELHDAARAAPPDRRQSLRADAAGTRSAAPRLDGRPTITRRPQTAIGFDRTCGATSAVEQYFPPVRDMFDNIATCPEKFLLWFHRCAWDYRMKSGKTLWAELCAKYHQGAAGAAAHAATWQSLSDRSTRSATRKSPIGWRSRSRTPPAGATRSFGTSRASASGRSTRSESVPRAVRTSAALTRGVGQHPGDAHHSG